MTTGAPPADHLVLADPVYRALSAQSTAEALRQGGRGAAWIAFWMSADPWDRDMDDESRQQRRAAQD
jgi:hypothetical protein